MEDLRVFSWLRKPPVSSIFHKWIEAGCIALRSVTSNTCLQVTSHQPVSISGSCQWHVFLLMNIVGWFKSGRFSMMLNKQKYRGLALVDVSNNPQEVSVVGIFWRWWDPPMNHVNQPQHDSLCSPLGARPGWTAPWPRRRSWMTYPRDLTRQAGCRVMGFYMVFQYFPTALAEKWPCHCHCPQVLQLVRARSEDCELGVACKDIFLRPPEEILRLATAETPLMNGIDDNSAVDPETCQLFGSSSSMTSRQAMTSIEMATWPAIAPVLRGLEHGAAWIDMAKRQHLSLVPTAILRMRVICVGNLAKTALESGWKWTIDYRYCISVSDKPIQYSLDWHCTSMQVHDSWLALSVPIPIPPFAQVSWWFCHETRWGGVSGAGSSEVDRRFF